MNMLDMELDNECKLKIIIVLLFFIIGYLGIMTGIIAMSLKWGFYTYNNKFDHLKELLLHHKEECRSIADNTIKINTREINNNEESSKGENEKMNENNE
uniref:Uncharacterized protein n=1 Tax=viral metagenome TaxID=1070528 RepID=A0A6C0E2I0_9ZZZZ